MNRKRILIIIGFVCILMVVGVIGMRYMPSREWLSLEEYYLKKGMLPSESLPDGSRKIPIILNATMQENVAIDKEGVLYLPVDWINEQIDSRFYSDGEVMIVTDAMHIWTYVPDSLEYEENGEKKRAEQCLVIEQDSILYVHADWVQRETGIQMERLEEPSRIWIRNQWDKPLEYALTKNAVKIRYQAGMKSPILEELEVGERVWLRGQLEKWTCVQTERGVVGYVPTKRLGEIQTMEWHRETELPEYPSLTQDRRLTMVWHQTIGTDGLEGLQNYVESRKLQKLDVIIPSWFTLSDNEGAMEYRGNSQYTTLAHENQIQVWAMVDNLNYEVDSLKILLNTKTRKQIEQSLIAYALQDGIDGINLDLELITGKMATHFIQFIREMSVLCRQNGLVLSVDDPVLQGWNGYYRFQDQAQVVDYIMIMGYDEHWAGGDAGSTASYPFVKDGIERTLSEVPKEKLILGIPFYTRVWNVETSESYAIGMQKLQGVLHGDEVEVQETTWLEEEKQTLVKFTQQGNSYQVWVEDEQSLQWKLELANLYDLAGVSAWKLGFESDTVWKAWFDWKSGN